ncbi:hypothetical protein HYX00_01200 [Candidatus Woesearchaeota archaeon]|nr:hypothetical protein [Candidatus Woesearchaeota archaeon]
MSEIAKAYLLLLAVQGNPAISEHAQKFHYDLNRVQVPKNAKHFLGYL